MGMQAEFVHGVLSGKRRNAAAVMLRGAMRLAEPFYAAAMIARNKLYERGSFASHKLPVPVISVGNVTAGGTGKTPMVRWVATRLREAGLRPGILMRGYKSTAAGASDEGELLAEYLPGVPVCAQPDRVAGGERLLREHPDVNAIILDDGFQHRRLKRDFDLVLIDASNPFGYGHVHPRGLLREPLGGLARASAIVLTRSDLVSAEKRGEIEAVIRRYNPSVCIHAARHAWTGFRAEGRPIGEAPNVAIEAIKGKRFFAMAGIANPDALHEQLGRLPGEYVGHRWFGDHHDYTEADLQAVRREAGGAEVLLATEKDWIKLRHLESARLAELPIWRIEMEMRVEAGQQLIDLLVARHS